MPGGRGVSVVKTVRFDIVNAGEGFRDRMSYGVDVENKVSGQSVLDVKHTIQYSIQNGSKDKEVSCDFKEV